MGINMTITSFRNFSKDTECDKSKKIIIKKNIKSTFLRGSDAGDVGDGDF